MKVTVISEGQRRRELVERGAAWSRTFHEERVEGQWVAAGQRRTAKHDSAAAGAAVEARRAGAADPFYVGGSVGVIASALAALRRDKAFRDEVAYQTRLGRRR